MQAAAPDPEELAAYRDLLAQQQSQRPAKVEDDTELVGEEACIGLPALAQIFGGKKHSQWTVHEANPVEM